MTCLLSHSIVSYSLWLPGLQPPRLLCPWDFPGKNTELGCHFLLQGIFQTQGSDPHLLSWRRIPYPLSHQGSPILVTAFYQTCLLSHITFLSFALVTLSSFLKEGKSESHSVVSTTPWTATAFSKAFLSVEFSRQEYWSELSFPSPGESNLGLLHCRWTQTIVWATREAFMDIAK